ncbi:hypothetical protein ACFCZ1_03055 [Streptomyces sp. NPDC056224]|uniref:hypothetical protein n=1 Tax=Streptomyces sp. NPDC056224 TaxID=3345750 RepID=UPI0035E2CB7F
MRAGPSVKPLVAAGYMAAFMAGFMAAPGTRPARGRAGVSLHQEAFDAFVGQELRGRGDPRPAATLANPSMAGRLRDTAPSSRCICGGGGSSEASWAVNAPWSRCPQERAGGPPAGVTAAGVTAR